MEEQEEEARESEKRNRVSACKYLFVDPREVAFRHGAAAEARERQVLDCDFDLATAADGSRYGCRDSGADDGSSLRLFLRPPEGSWKEPSLARHPPHPGRIRRHRARLSRELFAPVGS